MTAYRVTTYRIQWREHKEIHHGPGHGEPPWIETVPGEWHDIPGEEYDMRAHAESRLVGFWNKLDMPLQFEITKGTS